MDNIFANMKVGGYLKENIESFTAGKVATVSTIFKR